MHSLIVGISDSGKSTAAHMLAADYLRHKVGVLVLDPHQQKWPCTRMFTDPLLFLAAAKASRRCALFIEEAGECIGRGKHAREMQWITTGARKWGHSTYLIAQRAQQIELTIRAQCTRGYIFRQSEDDAKALCGTFADKRLMEATQLQEYEFLYVKTFGDVRRMKFKK